MERAEAVPCAHRSLGGAATARATARIALALPLVPIVRLIVLTMAVTPNNRQYGARARDASRGGLRDLPITQTPL